MEGKIGKAKLGSKVWGLGAAVVIRGKSAPELSYQWKEGWSGAYMQIS